MNLSLTVLSWYQQRKAPPLAIFKKAAEKRHLISIHAIINLNAGGLGIDPRHEISNTLNILKLRRKRGLTAPEMLWDLTTSPQHKNTARRFLRGLERANARGSK